MHKHPPTPPDPIERWEGEGGRPDAEPAFDWRARLEFDPDFPGMPFVKGTTILASDIASSARAGATWDRIAEFRGISRLDILACVQWAEEEAACRA